MVVVAAPMTATPGSAMLSGNVATVLTPTSTRRQPSPSANVLRAIQNSLRYCVDRRPVGVSRGSKLASVEYLTVPYEPSASL